LQRKEAAKRSSGKKQNKVVHHPVVKIFTTQLSITSSGFDFKDTIFNGEDGYIKSTTTKIEDEDITFTTNLINLRRFRVLKNLSNQL